MGDPGTLFTRFGGEINGQVRFDRALAISAEIDGGYWRRAADVPRRTQEARGDAG